MYTVPYTLLYTGAISGIDKYTVYLTEHSSVKGFDILFSSTDNRSFKQTNFPFSYASEVEVVGKEYAHDDGTTDSLVKEVSEEGFKCDVCEFKCKTDLTLKKHNNTKHLTQNPESISRAKFFCHECNTSYQTKKSFKKHNETIHNVMKPYICETCGKKFKDKTKHDEHQIEHKQNSSFASSTECENCTASDVCEGCLDHLIAKGN